MYRKTYVEINLNNISNNVKNIISKYNNYKYYIAMVKSNAYNHGYYIVNEMINSGINYLSVSSINEAIQIRKYNKEIPILVTEIIDLDNINEAIKNNITLTVCNIDYLKEIIKINKNIKIHIKIDTGMHRLGVSSKEKINEMYTLIKENKSIYLEGLYTHFATPGVKDNFFDIQVSAFKEITSDIDLNTIPIIHLSSSFILLTHPKIDFANGIRIGTILYGYNISPTSYTKKPLDVVKNIREKYLIKKYNISKTYKDIKLDLKKCFSIKTNIMQIIDIEKDEYVGYGLLFKANRDSKIATIPIGYDDGIGINHTNRKVIINKKEYPVIGEISMCMMNVLIDDTVNINDEVTIIGDSITLGSIASLNNTSFHNTLVNIGKTLDRRYIKDGKIIYEEHNTWEEQ